MIICPRILISTSLILLALSLVSATPLPSPNVISGADSNALSVSTRDPSRVSKSHAQSKPELFARYGVYTTEFRGEGGDETVVAEKSSHSRGTRKEVGLPDETEVRELQRLTNKMYETSLSEDNMVTTISAVKKLISQLQDKNGHVNSAVFSAIGAVKFIVSGFQSRRQDAIEAIESYESTAIVQNLRRDPAFATSGKEILESIKSMVDEPASDKVQETKRLELLVVKISYLSLAEQTKIRDGLEKGCSEVAAKIEGWEDSNARDVARTLVTKWKKLNSLVKDSSKSGSAGMV
ncbi:hypothetical protein H0H93_009208 [Arthromyces matolae]|nr:hypothetical protein H0H93_009208 [Arthromyces matolae]